MRPDAILWRDTNKMAAVEFKPRRLIYRKVLGWLVRVVLLQTLAAIGIWYLLRRNDLLPESVLTSIPEDLLDFAYIAAANIIAFLGTVLIVVPPIWRTLHKHTTGLQDVLEGLRNMAAGMAPKPVPAGHPGEIGYLAVAFNDMSSRLLASRRALEDANRTLERRVEERTAELRTLATKLDRMASTDAMTNLSNRRAMTEHGPKHFEESLRNDTDLICLLIDLDGLKAVNDQLGHARGDELICAAADVLRQVGSENDLIARLGGDEFAIVPMSMSDIHEAPALAQRLQAEFQRRVAHMLMDCRLPKLPSMSIGIASRKTAGAKTFEDLVIRADAALYRAKELGRNRAEVYAAAASERLVLV